MPQLPAFLYSCFRVAALIAFTVKSCRKTQMFAAFITFYLLMA